MQNKLFVHNIFFRLFAPLAYGIFIYFLILLVFDSLDQISTHFFSGDILITILLTYFVFGGTRQIIIIFDKLYIIKQTRKRITIQLIASIIITLLLTNIVIITYFRMFFYYQFSSFTTELITFNILYFLTGIFYNMLYFSVYFLHEKNEIKIQKEKALKENLETELMTFKKEINPDLFFSSLETLISLVNYDGAEADKFIKHFSDIYRYILENKRKDLISLKNDLKNLYTLLYLLNIKYNNNISFNCKIADNYMNHKIIPCTFQILLENAVNYNIITSFQPMALECFVQDKNTLIFKHTYNPKILISKKQNMDKLDKSYAYYMNRRIERKVTNNEYLIIIPTFNSNHIESLE